MKRIVYFYEKIMEAWSTGTLWSKSGRFLATIVRRPFEVMTGYIRLSKSDRNLNIKDGFADHRQKKNHHKSNPEHLRRIITAYKASKQAQCQAALPFKIHGLWAEWISVNYKTLKTALRDEDMPTLSCLLDNLFREQCTIGVGGYDSYLHFRSLLGSFYIKYVWCKYRDKLLALDFDLQRINFPLAGNPTGILLNGKVIPFETLRHAYHSIEMSNLMRDIPDATVVEIGAGLGGQAYQSFQICGDQISKYLVFDIPEVAALSSYFLLSAFPDKRVRLYGEGSVSVSPNDEYDIAIFPHFTISQLPDSSVDLFYNSCSFSEMDGASCKEYLRIIERACCKYFLHDNHDTVLKFKNADGSISTNVIGSKLIPNPNLYKRIFKKPRVHSLPEDWSFIHFEYLYEKI